MSDARAFETLALRVLEQWCLVGDEPMEGEQWEMMCELAGVNPAVTADGATFLREKLTVAEREARLRALNHERQIAFRQFDREQFDAA